MLVEVPLPVWKMSITNSRIELAIDHIFRRLLDEFRLLFIQYAELVIDLGRAGFDQAHRADKSPAEPQIGNREIFHRPSG